MIPRLHLFEIEDQPWCPGWLRDAMTDYLAEVTRRAAPYAPAADLLRPCLQRHGVGQVLDLCSGAGGPWEGLQAALAASGVQVQVICSDAHPNPRAAQQIEQGSGGAIRYLRTPHAVFDAPPVPAGFRTMFSALHHFAPQDAAAILRSARDAGVGIAAFEATQRSARGVLGMLLIPLVVLAITPLIRPRRWWRFVFTYLIPVIPLAVWWDGTVSSLRTYSVPELQRLADTLAQPGYRWQVGEASARGALIPVTYIIGEPDEADHRTT